MGRRHSRPPNPLLKAVRSATRSEHRGINELLGRQHAFGKLGRPINRSILGQPELPSDSHIITGGIKVNSWPHRLGFRRGKRLFYSGQVEEGALRVARLTLLLRNDGYKVFFQIAEDAQGDYFAYRLLRQLLEKVVNPGNTMPRRSDNHVSFSQAATFGRTITGKIDDENSAVLS